MLWTGRDFVFLDFEGDVTLPISERRLKRSPLRDVARMLRSFHHAAYAGFHQQVDLGVIARENLHEIRAVGQALEPRGEPRVFAGLLPRPRKIRTPSRATGRNCASMLLAYLLNQVVDELGRELRLQSDNVRAPLRAIIYVLAEPLPLPGSAEPAGPASGTPTS